MDQQRRGRRDEVSRGHAAVVQHMGRDGRRDAGLDGVVFLILVVLDIASEVSILSNFRYFESNVCCPSSPGIYSLISCAVVVVVVLFAWFSIYLGPVYIWVHRGF